MVWSPYEAAESAQYQGKAGCQDRLPISSCR
jgi:hypothetical protein